MTQSIAIGGGERSVAARIGLTALNLVSPGLGLMRIGAWRAGVTAMLAPFTLIAVIGFGLGHFPMTSYRNVMLALATIGILAVVSYAVPAVLTWRRSRNCRPSRGWSRWYGLTAIVAVNLIVCNWRAVGSGTSTSRFTRRPKAWRQRSGNGTR